jgi:murein DD-endopeptidase MepM/ murein hydrolase activator NlpD
LARNRKYVLDLSDLQFKQIRLPWSARLRRSFLWFSLSLVIAFFYCYLFQKQFGSPKEKLLAQQIENMKLQYSLLNRELNKMLDELNSLTLSDNGRYRTILEMDTLPETYRKGGVGGVDRFSDLKNYSNAGLVISFRSKAEEIKNRVNIQKESFDAITREAAEWKRQTDHFPGISPVSVQFRLGDGYRFRPIHPVWGVPRMHNGQDFEVPYGTEVYATGDGIVIEAGRNNGGFGNYIVIDHDYGLQSLMVT